MASNHASIQQYLFLLLSAYFSLRSIGRVITQPLTLKLPNLEAKHIPDLVIVSDDNPYSLHETFMDGAPDICIEIVSPDSVERDRGIKFKEYELGGVPEYWILDPIHREPLFYRLGEEKLYVPQSLDEQGNYHTPALRAFALHTSTLWTDPLPDFYEIARSVKTMLENS